MYKYLHENNCTDGALARGIQEVNNSYSRDYLFVKIGFSLSILSIVCTVLVFLINFNKTRQWLKIKLCPEKEKIIDKEE